MEKVDTLVVDKTDTLTEGRPYVTHVSPAAGYPEKEVLRLAAAVERASEHPLGLAVVRAATDAGLDVRRSPTSTPPSAGQPGHGPGRRPQPGHRPGRG